MPEYFTDKELEEFYLRLESETEGIRISASEVKKLLNVLRAYDLDSTCVLSKYWR